MEYLSSREIAKKWNISDRSVRNYCAHGKIKGAFLTGKTWNIPAGALKPQRENSKTLTDNELLNILRQQKDMKLMGGIYHKTQIELTYNSNHIEGSKLTEDQTRLIFETNTIGKASDCMNVDDLIETTNHFNCVRYIIENAKKPLTEKMIKNLHFMLKVGTSQAQSDWFNVGEYKKIPNEVGGKETTLPQNVQAEMKKLLLIYDGISPKTIFDIIHFHQKFESIHPFQDGNGRVGRLIMFKECLAHNIVPFIITDEIKFYYYRGLKEYNTEPGYLTDTILSAQDRYKKYLEYFQIKF